MKRFYIFMLLIVVLSLPAFWVTAQDRDLIILNDATPGIDVLITMPPGTSGVVTLESYHASLKITDQIGTLVFQSDSDQILGAEFFFDVGASTHTLTIDRLNGAAQAYVRVSSQATFTELEESEPVTSSALITQQSADYLLSADSPSAQVDLKLNDADTVTTSFSQGMVMAQFVYDGAAIATMTSGELGAVRLTLKEGEYQTVLVNGNLAADVIASMSIAQSAESDFVTLAEEEDARIYNSDETTATTEETLQTQQGAVTTQIQTSNQLEGCMVTLGGAINIRSGPGAGYNILAYGAAGDVLPVGGVNDLNNWLLVGTEDGGSGWIAASLGTLTGSCTDLAVYDIPFRSAPEPVVVIQNQSGAGGNYEGSYEGSHEEHGNESSGS